MNGSRGYSQEALRRLETGTYRGRKQQYRTSEDQVKAIPKKVPALEGMTRSPSFDQTGHVDTANARRRYEQRTNYKPIGRGLDKKDADFLYKLFDQDKYSSGGNKAIAHQARNNMWVNTSDWENKYGKSIEQIVDDYSKDYEKIAERKNKEYGRNHKVLSTIGNVLRGATVEPAIDLEATVFGQIAPNSPLTQVARNATEGYKKQKEQIKSGVTSNMSDTGKGLYEGVTNLAEKGLSYLNPSAAKYLLTYGKTAENKRQQLKERGIEGKLAGVQSGITGLADAALDYAGFEALPALKGLRESGNIGKMLAGGAAVGGGEQALTSLIELATDRIFNRDQSINAANVRNYMAQGLSKEDAETQAFWDDVKQVAIDTGSGAAFGTLMQLPRAAKVGLDDFARKYYADHYIIDPDDPILNDAVDTSDLKEYAQDLLPQNNIPMLTDGRSNTAISGQRYAALPERQLPAIQLPGSNGTIELPDLSSQPRVTNRVKTVAENAPRNPRLVRPLEGDALKQAKADKATLNKRIQAKNNTIKLQEEIARTGKNKAIRKAETQKLNVLKTELAELKKQKTAIDRQIKGQPTPIMELLTPEEVSRVNDFKAEVRKVGNMWAGSEGKELAKRVNNALDKYIESGSQEDLREYAMELMHLQNSATESYTSQAGNVSRYSDYNNENDLFYGGTSGLDSIFARSKELNGLGRNPEVAATSAPIEVDPGNVIYHAGTLSRLNKADSAGKMEGTRDTGYYGTGHYFVDNAHKTNIGKGSGYGDKPYTSVDISKYNNLFKADTDAKANALHDFSQKMMRFVNKRNDRYYSENGEINPERLNDYMDELYTSYKKLFGSQAMSRDDFETRLNQFRDEYEYDFYDRGDSAFTTFMKEHGYNGVDTRGTNSANTERGIVIYDLDEDSILQSNVADEAVKNGLMNTRVRNGQPLFDEETDARIQGEIDSFNKRKAVRDEYRRIYDESRLQSLQKEIEQVEEELSNINEDALPYYRRILEDESFLRQEAENLNKEFRMFGLPGENVEEIMASKRQTAIDGLAEADQYLAEDKAKLAELQEAYAAEEALSKAAYDQAKANVDNNTLSGYNDVTKGDFAYGTDQTSIGNDGAGSEGILREVNDDGRMGTELRGNELEGRGFLSSDSVRRAKQLKQNGSVYSDEEIATLKQNGIDTPNFNRANTDPELFSEALEKAKESNPNGAAVDSRSPEELQEIIDNGGNLYLVDDGTAGYAVEGDGNLTAVFKNSNNETPFMGSKIALASAKEGAIKGDCYGRKLVNMYSRGGFEPVARMDYVEGFNPAMDAQVKEQLENGIIDKAPDIYALKRVDGLDYDTIVKNQASAKQYSQAELDQLPYYPAKNMEEGEIQYSEMMAYRDSLIEQGNAAQTPERGYWLRLLGDENFLWQEAQNNNVSVNDLRSIAAANAGLSSVPPANDIPHMNGTMPGDNMRTSQTYTDTGKNAEGWTEEEYNKYTDPSQFQYESVDEEESVRRAADMRQREGREGFKERMMNANKASGAEIDGLMMEWRELGEEARALEAAGQDASDIWHESVRVFRKIQQLSTESAQGLQALAKWSRNTPEGMLADAENIINGKKKGEKNKLQEQLDKLAKQNKKVEFSESFVVQFLKEAGNLQGLDPDSREAREIMAKLGRMVNSQLPATFGEKLTSFLMDNMLGNFRTLITRNAGGNVGLNLAEQILQRPLAAGIDSLLSIKTGQRTQAGLTKEGLTEYIQGFAKGLKDEALDYSTGLHTSRTGQNTLGNAISSNRHVFKNKIMDRLDNLVKQGLSVGDRPFYEAVYNQTIGDYNRLRQRGVMSDDIQNLSAADFKLYSRAAAELNALAAVYQQDTTLSKALLGFKSAVGDLSRGILGVDILSQFSMPFVKTPANVIERAIDYSPLGGVRNAFRTHKERKSGTFDQNRFANETARNILGTALMGGGAALAANGLISGSYSDDKDEKQAQRESGMQEYALNMGDKQMDIGWIPVVGSNNVAAAAAYDAFKNGEGNAFENAATGLKAGGQALFDQSMFQGLQRLFGTGETYNTDEGIVGNMANVVKQGLGQGIPSLFRQAGQVIDPYQRDVAYSNEGKSFGFLDNYDLNSLANNVPFLREKVLAPKVATTGELLEENQGRGIASKIFEDMILPGKVTKVEYSKLNEEAKRLKDDTTSADAYMPKAIRKNVDTEEHTLTNKEWSDYEQRYYKELTEVGTKILDSDFYKDADSTTQVKTLKNAYDAVKSAINSEYNGKEIKGAAKKYVEAGGGSKGVDAVVKYYRQGAEAEELGVNANTYRKKEDEKAGSGKQYAEEKNNKSKGISTSYKVVGKGATTNQTVSEETKTSAKDLGLQTKTYNKIADKAGANAEKVYKAVPELQRNGLGTSSAYYTYADALKVDPNLSSSEFAKTFNAIDADNSKGIKQDELIDYFNQNKYSQQQADRMWKMYGDSTWKKVPALVNGSFVKK